MEKKFQTNRKLKIILLQEPDIHGIICKKVRDGLFNLVDLAFYRRFVEVEACCLQYTSN